MLRMCIPSMMLLRRSFCRCRNSQSRVLARVASQQKPLEGVHIQRGRLRLRLRLPGIHQERRRCSIPFLIALSMGSTSPLVVAVGVVARVLVERVDLITIGLSE